MGLRPCGSLGAGCVQPVLHIPEAAAAWVMSPSAAETILQGVPTHPGEKEV